MAESPLVGRPYLQVYFECCRVYLRVYRHHSGRYYEARCPRCMRQMRFSVGPGGTSARRFRLR